MATAELQTGCTMSYEQSSYRWCVTIFVGLFS